MSRNPTPVRAVEPTIRSPVVVSLALAVPCRGAVASAEAGTSKVELLGACVKRAEVERSDRSLASVRK